jgi:hypothetical protein
MNTYQFATRVSDECADKYRMAEHKNAQHPEIPC